MDLTIVSVYMICDDLLISLEHQEHPLAKVSDAEVMTTAWGLQDISEAINKSHALP